ncbi:MAG TPA: alpha/beta hydrolase [Gammaproteobacteria bacterium]
MWRSIIAWVLVLLGLQVHAQGWIEYVNETDRFIMAFPGEPIVEDTTYPTELGVTLPARRYSAGRSPSRFVLTVVDYTQAERVHRERCAQLGEHDCDGLEAGIEVRGAIAFAAWNYRRTTEGEITYDAYAQVDGVPGHQLQITNPDGSRTFVAVHLNARRLYVLEGTVPEEAPPPVMFQQSLVVLDENGRRIRYVYDENDNRVRVAPPDPVAVARAGVAELGKQWNDEVGRVTRALYTELHRRTDSEGIRRIADLSYGRHALQTFDLYAPEQEIRELGPVLIYFHGGGLVGGDKLSAEADGLIYSNIAKFMARNGGVGINANYRLAPEVQWPSGAEDMRLLLEWVQANVERYGGDPSSIFIMGNSAGSTHVATYLFHEASQFADGPRVRGAILSSGGFRAAQSDDGRAYYGENAAEREPLGLVDTYAGEPVPIFLWSAEYDPASIEMGVAELYSKLCRKYRDCPMYAQFQGHNHVSHVMSIDSADTQVADALIRFYRSVVAH